MAAQLQGANGLTILNTSGGAGSQARRGGGGRRGVPARAISAPSRAAFSSSRRVTCSAYSANKPNPPPNYMNFTVKKTLCVPVREPAAAAADRSLSLNEWMQSPGNVMGVVFTADYVKQLLPDLWRIKVLRLPLLDWELSPEFDLNILPPETSAIPGGVRMISSQLRFAADESKGKLPPGFANMPIWTHIDTTLFIERGTPRSGGGG
eukprot:CAMPEP_0197577804 /NCGR_PEP_ID=MMETSP1326-20131121/2295_1 /TAXON_ID=1155430 /ORGANISM="Genus nov. species nov., Strain RCC2288" /LENGTH=206 /DNA_ID=CAMNT_0043140923 /DNA_START=170 /DNA_END=786 /DNA_ORIENTATION=+